MRVIGETVSTMKILCFGPQDVIPPTDGGKQGIFEAISALSRIGEITYVFPRAEKDTRADLYSNIGVRSVSIPRRPEENLCTIVLATLRYEPYKFFKYATKEILELYSTYIPVDSYDAILCFHPHSWAAGSYIRNKRKLNIPIIVRAHNVEYEIVSMYRKSLRPIPRILSYIFEVLTRKKELEIWRLADSVVFCSTTDLKTAVSTRASGRFILGPEGVSLPPLVETSFPGLDAPLLFLLNPTAPQGIYNLRWFISKFWLPAINRKQLGTTKLHVSGLTSKELSIFLGSEVADLERLHIVGIGFRKNLEQDLRTAIALVSPTQIGSGIRKKILEAMAHQCPVLATSLDIDSNSMFSEGENILSIDKKEDSFVTSLNSLKNSADLWRKFSESGRSTVQTHASWDQFTETIKQEILTLKHKGK